MIKGPVTRKGCPCFIIQKSKIAIFFASAPTALAVFGWKNQRETAKAQEEVL